MNLEISCRNLILVMNGTASDLLYVVCIITVCCMYTVMCIFTVCCMCSWSLCLHTLHMDCVSSHTAGRVWLSCALSWSCRESFCWGSSARRQVSRTILSLRACTGIHQGFIYGGARGEVSSTGFHLHGQGARGGGSFLWCVYSISTFSHIFRYPDGGSGLRLLIQNSVHRRGHSQPLPHRQTHTLQGRPLSGGTI